MKIFVIFISFIQTLTLDAQNSKAISKIHTLNFDSSNFYIVCRGTQRKAGLIAKKFNYSDTNITHIGIGYLKNSNFEIYNVVDGKTNSNSALIIDSINSFIRGKDTYYFSIWKCNNSVQDLVTLKLIINSFLNKQIYFDFSFEILNNDTLYCSEFCALVLAQIDQQMYKFHPRILTLNNDLYELILKRRIITYYPIDFFQKNVLFQKIFECNFP